MSTINVTNLAGPSSTGTAATLSSINGGPLAGTRNRIINGDMRIDARNNGASINVSTGGFAVDRWTINTTLNASFNGQRNAGSVTPPTGFTNYLGYTSTAAYSPGVNTTCTARQAIEGFNCADLAWGTANAQAVTLSFWVRSSLSGTHSGSLSNSAGNRSYVFSFSISAANTWEYKSIVVPGDTTGTWATDNTLGIGVRFNLGTGTGTYGASATGWQAGNLVGLTTAVQVSATNGATFYITGVQLEPGTVATPFERRSYGQELALCQRYYLKTDQAIGVEGVALPGVVIAYCQQYVFPSTMRAAPTVTLSTFNDSGNMNANTAEDISKYSVSLRGKTFSGVGSASKASGFWNAGIQFSAEL